MIITVDPGLCFWAYAIFLDSGEILEYKTIQYKASKKYSQEQRLFFIFDELSTVILNNLNQNEPIKIISERQFVDIMGQITGVIRAVAGKIGTEAILITPSSWKKSATGKGNISEKDLKDFVLTKYPVLINESEHVIDCAGIFIAYRNRTCQ